jgi:hypothetical protein
MKYRYLPVAVALVGILFSTSLFAGSKKKPAPPAQSPTIAAVTADSITVREAQVTKTLPITQFTEINLNGRKATTADLKPGMSANVILGTDRSKASRIDAMAK